MWNRIKLNLKNNFLSGLVVIIPLTLAIAVLIWLFRFFDNLVRPLVQNYLPVYIPGLGILLGLLFIYLVGTLTKNYLGRKLIYWGELVVSRIPIAKTVYSAVKQMVTTLTGQEKREGQRAVIIEYPRKGIYSIGILNGQIQPAFSKELLGSVLILTSINPASGFLVLVPMKEILFTNLSIEEAMKMIVSGGMALPEKLVGVPNQPVTED